ncbi:MAG: hypothetical protein JSV33_11955, partial [bacterium]
AEADNLAYNNEHPVKRLGQNIYQIGNLRLDGTLREISMHGSINMTEGMIELLACAPGGKTHESVLVIDVEPYHLQIALLLLGLEAGGGLAFQGSSVTPRGDSVEIFVKWVDPSSGAARMVRGEDLVYNVRENHNMKHTQWIFTGSRVVDGVFAAQLEKSLVTTYHDPNTIIDNPLPTGADDTVYEVNKLLVPPRGTAVEVIVKPYR